MRVCRTPNCPRRGAIALETAIVLPVTIMLTLGTCIIAVGIYYYQLVATLAREGARYASVHGTQYQQDTGNAAATQATIFSNAIQPMAMGMNITSSDVTVTWNTTNSPVSYNPNSNPPGEPVYNSVSVTVSYAWTPVLYLTGSHTLTSTSVMPMSY